MKKARRKVSKGTKIRRLRAVLQRKFGGAALLVTGHKTAFSKGPGGKKRKSSNIESFGYDAGAQRLDVVFRGGRRYQYAGVPPHVHRGLVSASSKGKAFHRLIRDKFAYKRLG